jgi:hypothetical protein
MITLGSHGQLQKDRLFVGLLWLVVWSGCNSGKYEKAECYKHEDCGACKRCVNGVCKATIDNETNCEEIAPADLSYANNLFIRFPPNVQIASLKPTWTGGKPTNYSVDRDLPTGLQIDPLTGEITGTPTKMQSPTYYTITASNSAGSTSTVITMAVLDCEHWGISQCFPVPPTGQASCYDDQSLSKIDCPGNQGVGNPPNCQNGDIGFCGQDAQYPKRERKFTCYNETTQKTCATDNLAEGDVVTDSVTGLMWQRTFTSNKNWTEAKDYCEKELNNTNNNKGYAGHADWRLPNPAELNSILDRDRYNPAIDRTVFPDSPPGSSDGWFWSSAPNRNSANDFWALRLSDGHIYFQPHDSSYFVRCVSGGQFGQVSNENSASRFVSETIVGPDSVVTDLVTGLMWQKYFTKECITRCQWKDALSYCQKSIYANHQDWRLPNVNELMSLVNYYGTIGLASDFPGMPSAVFWSSSSYAPDSIVNYAWGVNFELGIVLPFLVKTLSPNYVVCVRLGP